MLIQNTIVPTTTHSANADTGVVAVSSTSSFALINTLDNSKTIRRNPVVGDISVAHSQTKEFGAASLRHLLRVDLKANGNLPAASAYLVIAHPDSPVGGERALEAFRLLVSAMFRLGLEDLDQAMESIRSGQGIPILSEGNAGDAQHDVDLMLVQLASRLIGSEG